VVANALTAGFRRIVHRAQSSAPRGHAHPTRNLNEQTSLTVDGHP